MRSDQWISTDGAPAMVAGSRYGALPSASGPAYSATSLADHVLGLGGAIVRRLATPPRGGGAMLRWAGAWVIYFWLLVLMVGVARTHPAPAVATWLLVLAVEASLPIEPEYRVAHIGRMMILLLAPAVILAAVYPTAMRRAWDAAIILLAASTVDRRPLEQVVSWAGALAKWAAWLLGSVVTWLILTNIGLRQLHSMASTLDPRMEAVTAAIIQPLAGVLVVTMVWLVSLLSRLSRGGS